MSKLDKILSHLLGNYFSNETKGRQQWSDESKQGIKDLMLELVGENERPMGGTYNFGKDRYYEGVDKLKARLRQKIEEL